MPKTSTRLPLWAISITSLLSAALSLQMLVFEGARAEGQQQPGSTTIESSTESSIVVPPWCNWIVNIPESINFQPVDSNGNEIADFVYNGTAQAIASTASAESYYVAGASGLTEQAELDNCSWFGSPEMGAGVSFSLSGSTFQAYALNPSTGSYDIRDSGMDISLIETNPINLQRRFAESCATSGFDRGATDLAISISNFSSNHALIGLTPNSVSTNNFCSTTTAYAMKIPASLTPYFSNTRYMWFGPEITYTAILTGESISYSSLSTQSQNITFPVLSSMTTLQTSQTLSATASSGLNVSYASNTPTICSVSGQQVTRLISGTCSITASQAGKTLFYDAATSVTRTFTISKVNQTVTTSGVPSRLSNFTNSSRLFANSGSSGVKTWSTEAPCAIWDGPTLRRMGGTTNCTLRLSIAGDSLYNDYTQTWTVRN